MSTPYRYVVTFVIALFSFVSASWALEPVKEVQQTASTAYTVIDKPIRKGERDDRSYQAIRLVNQMQVLLISDHDATKSLAALALPVGSLQNPESQQGLAHYLEHMVLMGSKHYPEPDSFSQYLSRHGGSHNASTASYRTAYYLEVENDAFDGAVSRLADAIANPLFDPQYSDRERNAVNAELTMARTRDGLRMGQVNAETLNPEHPASRFFGGNLETLSDKPDSKLHDELLAFYQRYYSANLMSGVLYSNRSLPELAELAVKTFGEIGDRQVELTPITVPVATEKEQGVIIHYVPAQPRKQLRIDFKIDNNVKQFRSKTDTYVSYLLGNRSENTLSDWLQKQGLAESVNAGADPMVDGNGGTFVIAVTLTDKGLAERDLVIAAIFNYIDLMKKQGIERAYFDEIAHVLALDFRYQSISRDMRYVESLADQLLRLPIEHVLDGDYLADQYDAEAIKARLEGMTPQQARIWFISPDEPHNKLAYFVEAPYQMEKIAKNRFVEWNMLASHIALSLPTLNPYIPDDFTIVNATSVEVKPEWVVKQNNLRAIFMPSRYFNEEPRASVVMALRNENMRDDARSQAIFALLDYIAGQKLAELSYQASIGGINFSTFYSNGLVFSADGFTQRMPLLFDKMLTEYQQFTLTEQDLAQAKSWYIQRLDAQEKVSAYELALQPVRALNSANYTESDERRQALDPITIEDIISSRDRMLLQSTPELIVIGNFSEQQVQEIAQSAQKRLQTTGTHWWHGLDMVLDRPLKATLTKEGSSSDSALAAVYIPLGYDSIESRAYSNLLAQIIHPWFFKQLRTEEQLGYALFAFPTAIGEQWGIGFLLQSNSHGPTELYPRYLDFYQQAGKQLTDMTEEEFNQYKSALMNELREKPQTLSEEAGRYSQDFGRSNYQFDSRDKLIAAVEMISQQQLRDYFTQALFNQSGLALLSQVKGQQEDKQQSGYVQPDGWLHYQSASELQKQLTTKVRP